MFEADFLRKASPISPLFTLSGNEGGATGDMGEDEQPRGWDQKWVGNLPEGPPSGKKTAE